MKIEKELLEWHPSTDFRSLQLTPLQQQYLNILKTSSIESTVLFFLQQGWLISFQELHQLVEKLVHAGFVKNKNINSYFGFSKSLISSAVANAGQSVERKNFDFKSLPFFRSLHPQLADLLLQKSQCLRYSANSFICKAGDKDRDLFVLLSGHARIYKNTAAMQNQLVATLTEGSVFGEAGFFLSEPRSAHIVSADDVVVLKIPHPGPILDAHMKKDVAQSLQIRFWTQHALQKSPLFKNVPADCLDALGFSGRIVQLPANQVLFREGDKGSTAYVVIQGSLVISQNGKNINVLNQGSFLGEIALLLSQGQRTASAFSQQDTLLVEIHQSDFYKLLSQNLFLAKELEILSHERLRKDAQRAS